MAPPIWNGPLASSNDQMHLSDTLVETLVSTSS
jgi:hypothetical protein